jgi:hypothetical protein
MEQWTVRSFSEEEGEAAIATMARWRGDTRWGGNNNIDGPEEDNSMAGRLGHLG